MTHSMKKGKHISIKAYHAAYKAENRVAKNREAKLRRHLKKCPNDEVAQKALSSVNTKYKPRPGNSGPVIKKSGYQIVAMERKMIKGSMKEVPVWANLDVEKEIPVETREHLKQKEYTFYRLETRATVEGI